MGEILTSHNEFEVCTNRQIGSSELQRINNGLAILVTAIPSVELDSAGQIHERLGALGETTTGRYLAQALQTNLCTGRDVINQILEETHIPESVLYLIHQFSLYGKFHLIDRKLNDRLVNFLTDKAHNEGVVVMSSKLLPLLINQYIEQDTAGVMPCVITVGVANPDDDLVTQRYINRYYNYTGKKLTLSEAKIKRERKMLRDAKYYSTMAADNLPEYNSQSVASQCHIIHNNQSTAKLSELDNFMTLRAKSIISLLAQTSPDISKHLSLV